CILAIDVHVCNIKVHFRPQQLLSSGSKQFLGVANVVGEGGVGQQKLFGGVVIAVAQLGSPQVVHFAQGLLGQTLQGFFRGNTLFFSEGVGVFQQPLYLIRMQLPVVGVDVEGGGSALCASDGTQGGAGDHAQSLLYRCGQGWV